jgi:hypothetical protein
VKHDGTVVAWGSNASGESAVPPGLSEVTAAAAGISHSLALKDDGTVVAWGSNNEGQTNVPAGLANVRAVGAGFNHSLATIGDGTLVGWGWNSFGQATPPAGLRGVLMAIGGAFHTLAVVAPDTTPPQLSVSATPNLLWPPNHRYVTVQATVAATDDSGTEPTVELVTVTSNEPDNGPDDGNTVDDIVTTEDPYAMRLRAERSESGTGRVYTIMYRATDGSGNSATASTTVRVPRSNS